MKQLLAREERENKHLFPNLLHAMGPLMLGESLNRADSNRKAET
jgi:hypothetical protein